PIGRSRRVPAAARGPAAAYARMAPVAEQRVRIVAWTALVTLPLADLAILLAAPETDVRWENHPSHFWLVLGTSVATAILAYATGEVAARRGDGRLFLVSLWFLAAAGFLGLHALAT